MPTDGFTDEKFKKMKMIKKIKKMKMVKVITFNEMFSSDTERSYH